MAGSYSFDIPVPVGRTKDNPVEMELVLTDGFISFVGIQFPVGCCGLAHCRILHYRKQVWPTITEHSFASDGYVIPLCPMYDFTEPPYVLTAICWNDDDTYPHTITIWVEILPLEALIPFAGMGGMLRKFLKLVGIGG
ncbi:unnamed protein product [marine sediment metagenome]|uniref:Uncharacterized protein n=1 Tax=marine sediment metagenome TaxID=412755 RepID=X1SP19_9ZZZZ